MAPKPATGVAAKLAAKLRAARDKLRRKPKPKPKPAHPAAPAKPAKPAPAKPAAAQATAVKPAKPAPAPAKPAPAPAKPAPAPATAVKPVSPPALLDLPVQDLLKPGGGAWRLQGRVDWKKSNVTTFQGTPVLRVFYGKGSGTSSDPGVGGVAFNGAPRGFPCDRAMLSFEVFFEPGWDFVRGGKFGGFLVGHGEASGYRHSPTASSHRIMFQREGGAISYVYPPEDLPQADPALLAEGHGVGYFDDVFGPGALRVGEWNSVQIGLRMNGFGPDGKPTPDGIAMLQINGKAARRDDVRWSRSSDLRISMIIWNTFFGGPLPASRDCVAYYRNFRLLDWNP
jgi:hypothetical protein